MRLAPSVLVVSFVGVVACGGRAAAPVATTPTTGSPAATATTIDLEPMVIEVVRDERGGRAVVAFDARQLFDEGNAALKAGDGARALATYDRMLAEFPDSALASAARYNAGLALELAGDLDGAVARYEAALVGTIAARDAIDAELRVGAVRAEQGRFADAIARFEAVLAKPAVPVPTRIEATSRLGFALLESRDLPAAEQALNRAIALYEEEMLRVPLEGDYYVGMAYFYLAEIPHRQYVELPIRLPEAQMAKDVEAKAALVLVAQGRYEDTIGFGNLHWATASGYQIAAMQEELWQALVSAPIPPQLGAQAAAIYVREVRALARKHLEKALVVHQKNVALAEANRTPTEYGGRSRRRAIEVAAILARDAAGETVPSSVMAPAAAAIDQASPERWVPPPARF
jgi:tetratricopeptide (TPR) repeat protein